jgi:hypothetical protein
MQQAGGGEFAEVAADGVLGHCKVVHQLRGGDFAVTFQQQQNLLLAQRRQVDGLMSGVHGFASFCVFLRD